MIGIFQITCNYCGSFYHGAPANQLAKMPASEVYVRASVPLCPSCVDNPERIKGVRQRVRARILEQTILHTVHVIPGRRHGE